MSHIDFAIAKSKHINWLLKLSLYLEGKETLTKDQITSHLHCDLGKWIYSKGLEKYGHLAEMQALEQTHKELHASISRVFELKEAHKATDAQKEYENMKKISDTLQKIIDTLAVITK